MGEDMNSQTQTTSAACRDTKPLIPGKLFRGALFGIALIFLAALIVGPVLEASDAKRWSDSELVDSYYDLEARGQLENAVRSPVLPSHPAQTQFLDALAWYAAGTPDRAGTLTIEQLEDFLHSQSLWYVHLLQAKVEDGDENDYGRTRTWKVIQKLTMLREQMSNPQLEGRYAYPVISTAPAGEDPWERDHTLGSPEEFRQKVCQGSHQRPVLVKFGNTNCTQCMLFEMIGSVKELAQSPGLKDSVDVYKVWWGLRPDESFAGKISNPARLDELVHAEGVSSSPYFILYRNGRRYPCGDAFPDASGPDEHLAACLRQKLTEVPVANTCAASVASS